MTKRTARRAAEDLLFRREHSREELSRKLRQRSYEQDAIDEAITILGEEGLFSEVRFVENYIHRRSNTGYGPLRILSELHQRGISTELAEQYLDDASIEWREIAMGVRQKRFGNALPSGLTERAKQMRFLQYRGFSSEQIRAVMQD